MPVHQVKRAIKRLAKDDMSTGVPQSFDDKMKDIINTVRPNSLTSPERLGACIDAVRYIERYNIPGAVVECGVWKGGSSMAMAHTLKGLGSTERDLWLFDTFDGMTEPTGDDVDLLGVSASKQMAKKEKADTNIWAFAPIEGVQANMATTGYPADKIHYVQGKVEDTIPGTLPGPIALLRLDTDWYDSTKHELEHLLPLLSPNGVLIIDDYGHWEGAKKAVDEWLATFDRPVLLTRSDYTGRMAVIP